MPYAFDNGIITTQSLEYSVAYHCNLRCAGCSHLSPFAPTTFPSLRSFVSDLARLGTALHAKVIRLLGGEPLLNPEIVSFIREAKHSGIADCVMVTTNGLLLDTVEDDFFCSLDLLLVSAYPGTLAETKLARARARAQAFDTEFWVDPMPRFRETIVTRPHPMDWLTRAIFRSCKDAHEFHCHMLHEGRLYKCAVPPFLPAYLLRLGRTDYDPATDAFDIHASRDLPRELRDYLLSEETPQSCRYCLGYLGKTRAHRQLSGEAVADPRHRSVTRDEDLDHGKLASALFALCNDTGQDAAAAAAAHEG